MLSRIAESLYWIGRYVERAEDTARVLDVHVHHLLEAPTADVSSTCRVLLDSMGTDTPEGPLDARRVSEVLALEAANPSSIVSSLAAARNNARGVSEAISSEMWEALNATYIALPSQVGMARRGGLYAFFRFVRERSAVVAGLTDQTMGRDDAWRFLVLGRSLERTDMLARLIATGLSAADAGDVDWVVLLRSCSAHEAFLRTYSREPDPLLAAEFLVLDRLFPRSVLCALGVAEQCLAELDPKPSRSGPHDEARRRLGLVRAGLEFRSIEDLIADLPERLRSVQEGCSTANAAIAARFFRHPGPIEWMPEGTGLAATVGTAP